MWDCVKGHTIEGNYGCIMADEMVRKYCIMQYIGGVRNGNWHSACAGLKKSKEKGSFAFSESCNILDSHCCRAEVVLHSGTS